MILYKTVMEEAEAEQTIEKSRFISHIKPVTSKEAAEEFIAEIRASYKTATHNVPAFVIGNKMQLQWASDDGEPQGTSGAPIVQMLVKEGITNVAVVVTRYFGGIKLGTSGLIVAYKAAAAEAIAVAEVIEKTVDEAVTFLFEYPFMNDVMRIVKEEEPEILEQSYDMDCRMTLRIRKSMMPKLRARLEKVETLRFEEV